MRRATFVCCALVVICACAGCAALGSRTSELEQVYEEHLQQDGQRYLVASLSLRGDGTFRYRSYPVGPTSAETPPRVRAYEGVWRKAGRSLVFRVDECFDLAGASITAGVEGTEVRGYSSAAGVGFCPRQVDDTWTDPLWLFTDSGGPLAPKR
jgi:hypothetical protein